MDNKDFNIPNVTITGPVTVNGSMFDIHDNQQVTIQAPAITAQKKERKKQPAGSTVPESLQSEEAEHLMEQLVESNLLTDDWQPNGLSGAERALVASKVSERLNINNVWQVFGQLWGCKPETLRAYFNRALNQPKSLGFQDKLKDIFD